jgi:hypothetical protein
MIKIAGSEFGSINQRHGSANPDPDPLQNVMQHCCKGHAAEPPGLPWGPRPRAAIFSSIVFNQTPSLKSLKSRHDSALAYPCRLSSNTLPSWVAWPENVLHKCVLGSNDFGILIPLVPRAVCPSWI